MRANNPNTFVGKGGHHLDEEITLDIMPPKFVVENDWRWSFQHWESSALLMRRTSTKRRCLGHRWAGVEGFSHLLAPSARVWGKAVAGKSCFNEGRLMRESIREGERERESERGRAEWTAMWAILSGPFLNFWILCFYPEVLKFLFWPPSFKYSLILVLFEIPKLTHSQGFIFTLVPAILQCDTKVLKFFPN